MSHPEDRSLSSITAREGTQDHNQQSNQEPRAPNNGPALQVARPPYTTGQSQQVASMSMTSEGTIPSSSYNPPRQPINDAVASAFHTTDSGMPPELIHLITQNVIQQLQAHRPPSTPAVPLSQPPSIPQRHEADSVNTFQTGPNALPYRPPSTFQSDHPDSGSSLQGSPIVGRAAVYTPPSPHRIDESTAHRESTMETSRAVNVHGYQTGRRRDLSPFSRGSVDEAVMSESDTRPTRPEHLTRMSTDQDATVLEKHWGKLFDEQGRSTERLSDFLQGIALHLIEEYEPRHSLVITPDKMQKFYEDTKLDERPELYPWKLVFDDKTSSISRLLRDPSLKVQHHLVQSSSDARPDIPGLTPAGFATWMTLIIRAHPDHEYERLTKVLQTMAINHPKDRKERFPAALTRRLLPPTGEVEIMTRLARLMSTHCKIKLGGRNNSAANMADCDPVMSTNSHRSEAPPPPTVEDAMDECDRAEPTPTQESIKRASFVSATESSKSKLCQAQTDTELGATKEPSVTSIEDDGADYPTPQPPLERERKPYVAQPGRGKNHEVVSSGDEKQDYPQAFSTSDLRRSTSVSSSQRPPMPAPIAIHQRGQGQPQAQNEGPESPRSRTQAQDGTNLSRSGSQIPDGGDGGQTQRRRSNSSYAAPHPFSRTRSNSMYNNDTGRYHQTKRSPSTFKVGTEGPRATMPDLSSSNYTTTTATSYPPSNSYPQYPAPERYEYSTRQPPHDARPDPRNEPRYGRETSRDRDRDQNDRRSRPRFASSAADGYPYYDENYRGQPAYNNPGGTLPPIGGPYQYPPNAYRAEQR